jgi:ankyrin repeat protein
MQALLAAKADVTAMKADGETALLVAIKSQQPDMVKLLRNANAPFTVPQLASDVLLGASALGELEFVQILIRAGADVNAVKLPTGETALMAAARQGHLDVVETLVSAKADINVKSRLGLTAAEVASRANHDEVAAFLREHGASQ